MSFMDYLLIALDCVLVFGLAACILAGAVMATWWETAEGGKTHEEAQRR